MITIYKTVKAEKIAAIIERFVIKIGYCHYENTYGEVYINLLACQMIYFSKMKINTWTTMQKINKILL